MAFLQATMGGGSSSSLAELNDVSVTSPQDGDLLVYDSNTNKWTNNTTKTTVTLTINGAKEDIITIKDSNNITVGTCTFEHNQTSGTSIIQVPAGGGSYKFISSVAKSLEDQTSDYIKNIFISDTNTQTVNVYPTYSSGLPSVYPWYGNTFGYKNLIPTMTSNTTPNGQAWASANAEGSYAYEMFDNNSSTFWNPPNNTIPVSVGYEFVGTQAIKAISINPRDYNGHPRIHEFKVYASNTGFTDNLVEIFSGEIQDVPNTTSYFALDNNVLYKYWVITVTSKYESNANPQINSLEFLGISSYIVINGAKEDNITITDNNNSIIGSCVFGSGKTYGLINKSLLGNGTYTFTSSVSKDITIDGTHDYQRTITIDGSEIEINVMPDGCIYWFGNEIIPWTYINIQAPSYCTYTKYTNYLYLKCNYYSSGTYTCDWMTNNVINLTGKSKLIVLSPSHRGGSCLCHTDSTGKRFVPQIFRLDEYHALNTLDISSSESVYISLAICGSSSTGANDGWMDWSAVIIQ